MAVRFDEMYVGQQYIKDFYVTEEDGKKFAEVSHDYNLLHLDEEYARGTMFNGRIAHGMLSASFISGVLGNDFPGVGTVYLEQQLSFLRPVRYGDTISVVIVVTEIEGDTKKVKLSTVCQNQKGEKVIDGYARIMKKD